MPRTIEIHTPMRPERSRFLDMRPSASGKPSGSAISSVKANISSEVPSPRSRSASIDATVISLEDERLRLYAVLRGDFRHRAVLGDLPELGFDFVLEGDIALLEADAVRLGHHDLAEDLELPGEVGHLALRDTYVHRAR